MDFERLIYKWVYINFGEAEAEDPSWNIQELAQYLQDHMENEDVLFV